MPRTYLHYIFFSTSSSLLCKISMQGCKFRFSKRFRFAQSIFKISKKEIKKSASTKTLAVCCPLLSGLLQYVFLCISLSSAASDGVCCDTARCLSGAVSKIILFGQFGCLGLRNAHAARPLTKNSHTQCVATKTENADIIGVYSVCLFFLIIIFFSLFLT